MQTLQHDQKVNKEQERWKNNSIENAIETLLQKNQQQDLLHFTKIRKFWNLIVGEQLFDKIKPQKLEKKTLYIVVEDAAYAHHLKYFEKSILDLIASPEICGESVVKKITFRVGKLPHKSIHEVTLQKTEPIPSAQQSEDSNTPEEVTSTAKIISNKDLRNRFSKLMKRITAKNKDENKKI